MHDKKKLFLSAIAKNKNMEPAEVLAALIPHCPVHAFLENLTHIGDEEVTPSNAADIDATAESFRIRENYLHIIFNKGAWKGNKIRVPRIDVNGEDCGTIELTFAKNIRLTPQYLFVYEPDLVDLESRNSDVFPHSFPTESVAVPKLTGSRKDDVRIKATRQACDKATEELCQEKQILDNDQDNWKPKLLSDTGKATRGAYMAAVQARLGKIKLHRDTADEAWKAIPPGLKHQGRPREQ